MKFALFLMIVLVMFGVQSNSFAQTSSHIDTSASISLIHIDKTDIKSTRDSIVVPSTPAVVLGEIGLGSLLAVASTGLTAGISSQLTDYSSSGYAVLLSYLAYTFGNSLGVYIIAKKNNGDASLLKLWGVSAASAVVTSYIFFESDQRGFTAWLPVLMPLIAPIIYANMVYPPQPKKLKVEVLPNVSMRENSLQYGVNLRVSF